MLDKIYRKLVHGLIVKYLTRCGGAFHHGEYGKKGKYVVLFSDKEYSRYQQLI
jgi:hypothetical protein